VLRDYFSEDSSPNCLRRFPKRITVEKTMPTTIPIMKVITYPDNNILTVRSLLVEYAKSMPILSDRWFTLRGEKENPTDNKSVGSHERRRGE